MRSVLLCIFGAAGRARGSACEPHCLRNPCSSLNGNINNECGNCGPDAACRPGAEGFPVAVQPSCAVPEQPVQPGLADALAAAAQLSMRYECDTLECQRRRSRNVERLVSIFDDAAAQTARLGATRPQADGRPRNQSAIGFLLYTAPKHGRSLYLGSCYAKGIFDEDAPWWLQAIQTHPLLRDQGFVCRKRGGMPHYAVVAAYLLFVRRLDVRILTCDERSCLAGAEDVGTIIVRQAPTDVVHRVPRGEQVRDVCYALLRRLEARGVRV